MVILQNSPDSMKAKMKSYFKRVVSRPGGRKVDKAKHKHSHSGYLGKLYGYSIHGKPFEYKFAV